MAKTIILESGLTAKLYTEAEQNATWTEVHINTSPIGTGNALFTPQDNLEYFIDSETEWMYDKVEAVIRANGKTFKIKYNVCNQQAKEYKAVRKAYGF